MNKDKLLSDIRILDDLILSEGLKITHIEHQIEVKELTTNGDDLYFDWRVSAVTAANHMRARIKSIKRQSDYWKDILLLSTSSDKARIREENIARNETNKNKAAEQKERKRIAHANTQMMQNECVIAKQLAKVEMHKESESRQIRISKSFRKIIKELLGDEKYIELMQQADKDSSDILRAKQALNSRVNNYEYKV